MRLSLIKIIAALLIVTGQLSQDNADITPTPEVTMVTIIG